MACLIRWVHEFLKLDGVVALTDLLETLEKRTMKKVADFELMDQVKSPSISPRSLCDLPRVTPSVELNGN